MFFLNVCCVLVFYVFLCCSVCWFLYGPFCQGALKLDISTLFATFFHWTSLQFIFTRSLSKHSGVLDDFILLVYMFCMRKRQNNSLLQLLLIMVTNSSRLVPRLNQQVFNVLKRERYKKHTSKTAIIFKCIDISV